LAFPLLKKLSEYDSRAEEVFKEELAIRLKSGSQTVQEFLFNEYFNDIIELDEDINFNNLNIESLIMPNMKLNNFPDVNKLKKLTKVYVCGNNLETLPDSILKLEHLKCLNVCNNNLHSLPELIGDMENLEVLSIVNNKIISLPESITKLKNLKELYLSHNNLSTLPDSMGNLNNLKLLRLSNNKLKHSKKVLKRLKKELPLCEIIV